MMYRINYKKTVIRIFDNASIPPDPGNADYQDYLKWVALGNIAPIDPPPEPTAADIRYRDAKIFAKTIPVWALWTQQQLLDWWNANLADNLVDGFSIPVNVKTMLKQINLAVLRIAQLLVAIRNQIWPDLPDM